MPKTTQTSIEGEIMSLVNLERQYEQTKSELAATDDRLAAFFELERKVKETAKQLDQKILDGMTDANIKSIKGDWGSITVVERQSFQVDAETLPPEYKRLQPDLKKIGSAYALMGEAPAGVTPKTTRFLRKTFNKEGN